MINHIPLGDICEIIMGQAPPSSSYNTSGVGTPMIAGASDLGSIYPEASKYTTSPKKWCMSGDIIMCIRATIGDLNWSDGEYCLGRGVAGLRPDPSRLDSRYLWHWVMSQRDYLNRLGTGSTFLQIRRPDITSLSVPLPPLEEQRRIATVLDKADALRRKRQESLALMDEFLRSVFLEMFGDPVANPMGWDTLPLADLAPQGMRNGLSPSKGGTFEYPVLTLSAITSGRFDVGHRKLALFGREPSDNHWIDENDFLVCRGNGNRELVGMGVFPSELPGPTLFPDTVIGVAIDRGRLLREFLEFEWAQTGVRRQIEAGARTTSGIFKVNQTVLSDVMIRVPPMPVQQEFLAIVDKIRNTRSLAEIGVTLPLFESLVQRAFRGELTGDSSC